jgi:glycosyltransferase involved in cell wall biosynthesis
MIALGHKVVIACQPGSSILAKAREHDIPVEEVVIRGSIDPKAIWDLYRIIRKHRIDVVNTHSGKDSWPGGFAAKLARVDLLIRTRHLAIPLANNPFNFIHRMADGIITTGEAVRNAMIQDNGIASDRIVSIPTGVSLERFQPGLSAGHLRQEFTIGADSPVITMVAILRSVKRHDVLVEAAKQLVPLFPKLVFLVVGDGPGREWVREKISAAGMADHFILTGHRDDIPEIMALSDVIVLTSDKEGVPQSLTQAMAMEKAVIAAPVGGIPDLIIDDATGLFAEAGNGASFAAAIARVLADEELRERLGKAARQHVLKKYTDEIMATETIDFYDRLLLRKNGQRTNR